MCAAVVGRNTRPISTFETGTAPVAPLYLRNSNESQTMRIFVLSALTATAALASATLGMSTDASAATRHPRYRTQPAPIVRQDPYGAYNTLGAPGVSPYQGRRDVNPISGTPRWNAAGGAA
jgi:hypothetical protein